MRQDQTFGGTQFGRARGGNRGLRELVNESAYRLMGRGQKLRTEHVRNHVQKDRGDSNGQCFVERCGGRCALYYGIVIRKTSPGTKHVVPYRSQDLLSGKQ